MKAFFVNGSPRKNWNTHKMLESAMKGASDAGAECELVHLYDYSYKGCVSCFACKLKNAKTNGVCAYRDDLRPVLEKAVASDVIVMGSPIYFSYPTGMLRSFMERLLFPVMTYSTDENGKPIRAFDRKIYTATILTMNCPEELAGKIGYLPLFEANAFGLGHVMGYTETLCAYDTLQFTDYSRYEANNFDGNAKKKHQEEHFAVDLQNAYDLGKRLVMKAKEQE
ncbi:MAG: flavodoxin family protein [Synergistaceae bacterium]|nr:flavodoxin family protein [Synergistaceae bacterium]